MPTRCLTSTISFGRFSRCCMRNPESAGYNRSELTESSHKFRPIGPVAAGYRELDHERR